MVINSIEISSGDKSKKYNLKNDFNLIFSEKNSKIINKNINLNRWFNYGRSLFEEYFI